MGLFLLYALLALNAALSLAFPWVGVVAAYVVSVFGPQYVWWWVFEDLRPALWVTVPLLAGFAVRAARGRIRLAPLATRINLCVGLLWLFALVSYLFGPFVDVVNESRFYDPGETFATWQKLCLVYLVAVLLIDDVFKLRVLAGVLAATTAYMTWWANAQYFLHGAFGRLHGPATLTGLGIYSDENNFGVLFVVGVPFLYYGGLLLRSRALRLCAWLAIPFAWHAVFLTASRGALIGMAAALLVMAVRLPHRVLGVALAIGFVAAFALEAGEVMKSRSATISEYENEDSAASRIRAWEASMRMMARYPLTGVGFASFGQAFPSFADIPPRIAHNTFFQIGGEWGVPAAMTYVVLTWTALARLWRNGRRLARAGPAGREAWLLNEACLVGLVGFSVCALFLSLQQYEILYFLLLQANAVLLLPPPRDALVMEFKAP